jgi:hypothetical protein
VGPGGRCEGEGEVGLGRFGGELGRLAPGVGPVGLMASSFYFFLLLSFFSFYSDFSFEF